MLQKDVSFDLGERYKDAFDTLKKALTTTPIIQPPDWTLPFELMCDASNFVVGAVLAQRDGKLPHVIYYASRTLDAAQANYTTTEKDLLVIMFALDKFRPYILGYKVIVKGMFPEPWFADIVNYSVVSAIPPSFSKSERTNLKSEAKYYIWEDPILWRIGSDQVIMRCVPNIEIPYVLEFYHSSHYGTKIIGRKMLDCGFIGLLSLKMHGGCMKIVSSVKEQLDPL